MSRKRLMKVALPLAIVSGALLVAVALVKTRPTAERTVSREAATLVRVVRATRSRERVRVLGMGTVIPAQQVILQPEVSGRIVEQSPKLVPGGYFSDGEVVARIDPRDYELAVEQQKASVARAEFELKVEEGRRKIAEREWKLLEQDVPWTAAGRDLALRKPHMENAVAALEAARSGLERAQLDLERTTIRAPFNAVVREESVDVGQMISPQTPLATLIGTDRFWVQASVAVDRLRWIRFPDGEATDGSQVKVMHEAGLGRVIEREGRVVRLRGDLDPKGRMARILVAIDDPLSLTSGSVGAAATNGAESGESPLFVGAYVRVDIEGTELEEVFSVPRTALHDGERVWVMDPEGRLEIRDVEIAWRHHDTVLVRSGILEGERIVVSAISVPVPGMKLRLDESAAEHARAPEQTVASTGSAEGTHP
jgi:RND family efflux transporter MFP subunit